MPYRSSFPFCSCGGSCSLAGLAGFRDAEYAGYRSPLAASSKEDLRSKEIGAALSGEGRSPTRSTKTSPTQEDRQDVSMPPSGCSPSCGLRRRNASCPTCRLAPLVCIRQYGVRFGSFLNFSSALASPGFCPGDSASPDGGMSSLIPGQSRCGKHPAPRNSLAYPSSFINNLFLKCIAIRSVRVGGTTRLLRLRVLLWTPSLPL